MKMKGRPKWIFVIVITVCCALLLVWYFGKGRREEGSEKEAEQPAKVPSRVSVQQGESVITLDQATQDRSGIITTPLNPMTYRGELQAYGMVLEFQLLADLRKSLLDSRKNLVDSRNNLACCGKGTG